MPRLASRPSPSLILVSWFFTIPFLVAFDPALRIARVIGRRPEEVVAGLLLSQVRGQEGAGAWPALGVPSLPIPRESGEDREALLRRVEDETGGTLEKWRTDGVRS